MQIWPVQLRRRMGKGMTDCSNRAADKAADKTAEKKNICMGFAIGQDRERRLFLLILLLSFAAVLAFNLLTPMLSDDYSYAMEVRKATGIADLFRQEYNQYMTWNGRSVVHLLLRFFLYLPAPVFKIANSLAFVLLSLLMYRLTRPDRTFDVFTLLLLQMGLWLYAVDFSETILWEDGACNYLWGAVFILGFMNLERSELERVGHGAGRGKRIAAAVGLFLFGVLAGWCNENTSGGCLLYLLLLLLVQKKKGHRVSAGYCAGLAGNAAGLAVMVLSPGARIRASYHTEDENYSGLLGMLARVQKITLTIHEYFGLLLAVFLVCVIILLLQRNRRTAAEMGLYGVLFLATSYALAATSQTQARAFFGAGLFLLIALAAGIREAMKGEKEGYLLKAAGWSLLAVLLLRFFFVYVEDGTNLARIWRDETRRISYIQQQAAAGAEDITVPLVHPDFYNTYSAIEKMEMTENPEYWINIFYESYYGVTSIRAVDYDTWAAQTEGTSEQ